MTTTSSLIRAAKTSDSSRNVNKTPKVSSETLNVSSETCHNRILHYQVSESKDSTSSIKSISISCTDTKKASPMTSQCKSNSEIGLRSFVNKYYVQNQAFSDIREKSSNSVKKNLHKRFFPSTISYSNVYACSEYDKTMGGPASTCSGTSAKSQVTECDLNFGENKNTEGGVLVNNVDNSSNGNVNVSKLIAFYNSLAIVQSYALK